MLHLSTYLPDLPRPAVVSKAADTEAEYLRVDPAGEIGWVKDPAKATAFGSMREAARMALRLPSAARAFGMPLQTEVESYQHERLH
jgi:hypothetical protein